METQRVDKWLWFARIVKTRTLAAKLVNSGKLRLNKQRISKASQTIKQGDTLTFMLRGRLRILEISAIGTRRGPASEAQELYEDLSPPVVQEEKTCTPAVAKREAGTGRPTKKQRRDMEKMRKEP